MLIKLAILVGVVVEFIPMYLFASQLPASAVAVPYTPLELLGREIFVSERCSSCHTQAARPLLAEGNRYGDYSLPEDFKFDRPTQWGSLRVGPDLAQEGGKRNSWWHWQHSTPPSVARGCPAQESLRPPSPRSGRPFAPSRGDD